jgi:uncharacterized protein (TIGR00369 family)
MENGAFGDGARTEGVGVAIELLQQWAPNEMKPATGIAGRRSRPKAASHRRSDRASVHPRPAEEDVVPSDAKTYGTVSADARKEMSGLEFVRGLASGTLPLNTIARTLGYDIVEAESGRVVITAQPNDSHLNPAGTVHGGLSATLLDSCMGLAIQSTLEKGVGSTTLEIKISFVRPITPETGLIRAEGTVLNCGRRVGTAEGRVTDSKGRLLVHGTTTCLIFDG